MGVLQHSVKKIRGVFTPIRLNIIFLLVNIAVGIAIKNQPLIISSCVALVLCLAISFNKNLDERLIKISDQIVVASVMVAIFIMWFDTHNRIRSLSGLILLYAFGIYLIGKLNTLYNNPYTHKLVYELLHYFGSFGHFLFNLEYALLVLI